MIPSVSGECRISREKGLVIFVYNWGSQTLKPNHLRILDECHRPGFPAVLFGFTGREDGATYYATRDVFTSASFMWLLHWSATRSEAYSRMPLLLSPSQYELSVEGVTIVYVPEKLNDCDVDPKDGQLEISPDLVRWWGFYVGGDKGWHLYIPFQLRGLLHVGVDDIGLCKGMAVVNETLPPWTIHVPHSCWKCWGKRSTKFPVKICLDCTKDTERCLREPQLTPSLTSVLDLRCIAEANERRRKTLRDRLRAWVRSLKDFAVEQMPLRAMRVEEHVPMLPRYCSLLKEAVQAEPPKIPRISAENIRMRASEDPLPYPTPLELLQRVGRDAVPDSIRTGTKESAQRGSNNLSAEYSAARRKPVLRLRGFGATLFAFCNCTKKLTGSKCWVIVRGKALLGQFVLWRTPCQAPWDCTVFEAELPPPGTWLPYNGFVCAADGWCISLIAGGDFDGDLVMVSFDSTLLKLVADTAAAVEALDVPALIEEVMDPIRKQRRKVDFERVPGHRRREFVERALASPTPQLRGALCGWADRAARVAQLRPTRTNFMWALHWAILSHAAMDVPKHYTVEVIRQLCRDFVKESGVSQDVQRSQDVWADRMRLEIEDWDWQAPWAAFKDVLEDKIADEGIGLGMVWTPSGDVYLSGEAGAAMRAALLDTQRGQLASHRRLDRTALFELARLVLHRARQAGSYRKILNNGDAERVFLALRRSRAGQPMESLASLLRSLLA